MTKPSDDQNLSRIARDVRFLAYRNGKPLPMTILFFALLFGSTLMIAVLAAIGGIIASVTR